MTSVYDVVRRRCGLSQQEAADLRGVRLDTVKSWCSGRRSVPAEAIEELRALEASIGRAGSAYAKLVKAKSGISQYTGRRLYPVAGPADEHQAKAAGWPTASACLAAVAAAIAELPAGAEIGMVEPDRELGIPVAST